MPSDLNDVSPSSHCSVSWPAGRGRLWIWAEDPQEELGRQREASWQAQGEAV